MSVENSQNYSPQTDIPGTMEVVEATSPEDIREFYRLYNLNDNYEGVTDQKILEHADRETTAFNPEKEKIFVIKQGDSIIAGANVTIRELDGKKLPWFGGKFVVNAFRGHALAAKLVQARIDAVREMGYKIAYTAVRKQNVPALRTIFKDGFEIHDLPEFLKKVAGEQNIYYYLEKDLEKEAQVTANILSEFKEAVSPRDFQSKTIFIPLRNENLIQQALELGFVGKQIFLEKDLPEKIKEPIIYLEKE